MLITPIKSCEVRLSSSGISERQLLFADQPCPAPGYLSPWLGKNVGDSALRGNVRLKGRRTERAA
jgi:hypothetical protein